jgi:hypothetical protein
LLVPSRKRNHKTHRATPWNQPLPPSQVGPTSSAQNLKLPLHYTPMYGWYPAGVSGWGVATFASGHQQQSVRHLVGAQTWAGMQGLPHSLTASQPHSLTASQPQAWLGGAWHDQAPWTDVLHHTWLCTCSPSPFMPLQLSTCLLLAWRFPPKTLSCWVSINYHC